MRLVSILLGQSVVDMHCYFWCWLIKVKGQDQDQVDMIQGIIKFTGLICGTLMSWSPRMTGPGRKSGGIEEGSEVAVLLVRIQKPDGTANCVANQGQETQGKKVGNCVVWSCFI